MKRLFTNNIEGVPVLGSLSTKPFDNAHFN